VSQAIVDPTLVVSTEPLRLAGSRCSVCETVVFPVQDGCPKCSHRPTDTVALAESGVVWSWTVQQFAPKPPFRPADGAWSPLALGYVDLGDVIVEGWLVPADRPWAIGDAVRVVPVPAFTAETGVVHTYAFEYAGEARA
jgi:uncharacterized OB-fold protein